VKRGASRYSVCPQAFTPPQAAKHLKVEPTAAQSESRRHVLEHALAMFVQPPASDIVATMPRHDSPAAHSSLEVQLIPAARRGFVPHAGSDDATNVMTVMSPVATRIPDPPRRNDSVLVRAPVVPAAGPARFAAGRASAQAEGGITGELRDVFRSP
jgi:hypothetical protein